jgi:protein TonB
MQLRVMQVVYGLSALLHGALWFGVTQAPARPPLPKPIRITMRDVPPPPPDEPPPPPPPEPEPEVETPPEAAPIDVPEPAAPPEPSPPKPKLAKPEPAPAEPAPAAPDVPDFGLQLGSPSGPGGLSVPEGDPGGGAGGSKPERKRVESKARKLEAKPEKADTTCDEPEQKPRPIELPQPKYSDAARAEGIQGAVRVQLSIDVAGKVTAVKVLKSLHPELDEAAKQAVEAASFAPAMRCGAAVATTITI